MPTQQLHSAAKLAHVAREVHSKVLIAYGGLIFNLIPGIRSRILGHYIGEEITNVVGTVEKLVRQKTPLSKGQPVSDLYRAALVNFQEQQAAIEAQTWEMIGNNGIDRKYLLIANHHFNQDIEAALSLGDLSYLENEIAWLEDLLKNYEVPLIGLQYYLKTYLAAAQQNLDERGQLITEWLSKAIETQL